ncbi:TPA: heavy metal translocating P-type ATPase, partial [Candidatus Bathyarchaeota archaeon]|nr:heavy metal translocating P-type ATPase [Candidatus Bathyarchaeota archaeon]
MNEGSNLKGSRRKKLVFSISGMSCASCAQTIEKKLSGLKGVSRAAVNFAAEKAIVEYDPTAITQRNIEDAVAEAGYGVVHEKAVLPIGGMHCVECARTIEEALSKKEGVYKAAVNFAMEKATIEYNPEQVSLVEIKKTIRDAGYEVIELEEGPEDKEEKEREKHIRNLKRLIAVSLTLSVPTFIFSWLKISPILPNKTFLFLLATPVQFVVGWAFYVGAYKGLRNKSANMDTLIAMGTSAAWLYSTIVTFFPGIL